VEKENVIISQNAAGKSSNDGTFDEMKNHLSAISVVMIVICSFLALGLLYGFYKLYKKCHDKWSNDLIVQYNLRRSFRRDHREAHCHSCGPAGRVRSSSADI
jgi:Na+/melibiose symporter-like transporter